MNDSKIMTNCPSCSSNDIVFDISTSKLKCNHCGEFIEISKYKKKVDSISKLEGNILDEGAKDIQTEDVNIVTLKCPNCNTQYLSGESSTYPKCHWCGSELQKCDNNISIENEKILPFTISKEDAIDYIKREIKYNEFISKEFINSFNPEQVCGVYLPYMMIKAKYKCNFIGEGNRCIDYYSAGDDLKYIIYDYSLRRDFILDAENITFDTKNSVVVDKKNIIENIISVANPFDFESKKNIEGKYLKGFIAEPNYFKNININDKINDKLISVAKYAILDDISYYDRGVRWDETNIEITNLEVTYIYLPLWLYIYKNSDKLNQYYYVALNSRTNEIVFHLPANKKKSILKATIPAIAGALIVSLPIILILTLMDGFISKDSILPIIIGAILLGIIIFIAIFKSAYKKNIEESLGNNVSEENDSNAKYTIEKVLYMDKRIGDHKTNSSLDNINGCNDNGDNFRYKKRHENENVRTIKRKTKR